MVNFFRLSKIFICFLIFLFQFLLLSCSHTGLVSIPEQIAIYENMGFTKLINPENPLNLGNVEIKINTKDDISQYCKENNLDCKIDNILILFLQKNAENITSLIYIYEFYSSKTAKSFFMHFNNTQNIQLTLCSNYIIQKGTNLFIANGATNYKYYIDFCYGLK